MKKIRRAIRKQLQYVKRDLGYIELYLEQDDVELTEKQLQRIRVINELYEQLLTVSPKRRLNEHTLINTEYETVNLQKVETDMKKESI